MVLEATVIVEHSRNGDYLPSRFEAQCDAVNLIFNAKTQSNPESSVGLMTMGGAQPEVLTTLTNDFGKVLDGLHRTKVKGTAHFTTALNVAGVRLFRNLLMQLALKHRQNKSQHQRVIVFTCSPLAEDTKAMIKLAKRLKKNTINVDIVAFGDLDPEDSAKIEAFHENIKGSGDGSNLAVIPPGPNLLSDSIVSTPILAGDGVGGGGGGGGADGGAGGGDAGTGGSGFEFGVDPNMDPELALALRMSMQDEERRREREREEQAPASNLETVAEEDKPAEGGEGGKRDDDKGEGPSGDADTSSGDRMDTS